MEVCLFDQAGRERRQPLRPDGPGEFSARVEGCCVGQRYGFRVHGPWDPRRGLRFDPAKLLIDPYALRLTGTLHWHPSLAAPPGAGAADTAPWVPRSVVADRAFDWRGDRRPRVAWERTVIYECHVRGLTVLHPDVPEPLRGTFLGLAHPAVIDHLVALGVTTLELMPIAAAVPERHLAERGAVNYWGYSPIALLAPDERFASPGGDPVEELKTAVRALHEAGLEVILDVVLNHTAEGGAGGPTLSLRGLDNAGYYRLDETDASRYVDFTGCGNTLDLSRFPGVDLALDALDYWASEVRVDGFRFDLAPATARAPVDFDPEAPLLAALRRHPRLAGLKLVAEPWDLGPGGYRLGAFPHGWVEWNDRFRDGARRFWLGHRGGLGELGRRLDGSPDIFGDRAPTASLNYVVSHDGFTLADLVSYERKHNLANGEDNRDGSDHEISASWGIEGPTASEVALERRERVKVSLLATLALAAGVPMVSHGDELGRTQRGNNNAYCQDNETTWVDWNLDLRRRRLLERTRRLFAIRRRYPRLATDVGRWTAPDGGDLSATPARLDRVVAAARRVGDLLLLLNAGAERVVYRLPSDGAPWRVLLDLDRRDGEKPDRTFPLAGHSIAVLESEREGADADRR